MRAKQLIDSACYGPEALKIIGQAFDEAWISIAPNFGNNPATIEAARLKLAKIVLSFPHEEIASVDQVKTSSLLLMALAYQEPPLTSSSRDRAP